MKLSGGYLPKIAGRPSSVVEDIPVPDKLCINLQRGNLTYTPVVKNLQTVQFGQELASVLVEGGKLSLPSPAEGKIIITDNKTSSYSITLEVTEKSEPGKVYTTTTPEAASVEKIRESLAQSGIWPFLWSSATGGIPSLSDERPKAIVVNFIETEPFKARGRVILKRNWNIILKGINFMDRLLADYGTVEIVLTEKNNPVAHQMYDDLRGTVWAHFHPASIVYPMENTRLLNKMIRKASPSLKKEDIVWIIDAQGIEAVGECLSNGLPLYKRTVALGGPGIANPRHAWVRIGTKIQSIVKNDSPENSSILKGGLFRGSPIDPTKDCVDFDDDSLFFLPRAVKREFLSFLRPGFKRTSYLSVFATSVTGGADSQISTSLRGEIRPCISCSLCEDICPVSLLPQILHKYIYSGNLDDAEKLGLNLCIDCNLCTYICPSKIELQKEFSEGRKNLAAEHEEARALLAKKNNRG